jgi:phytoene/squalene synthetase
MTGPSLSAAITWTASKQTWATIRFLVPQAQFKHAYRAYAYFRWVDDVLDAETGSDSTWGDVERAGATAFLERQKWLLERCLRGKAPSDVDAHEEMLVELIEACGPSAHGVEAYLRNMTRVMEFDVQRRGRLVTDDQLNEYTHTLAVAVTEAIDHFLGDGARARDQEARFSAATGAHVLHMLRDTSADVRAGYYNVPRELLHAHAIGPADTQAEAYRMWVKRRVDLARGQFRSGEAYLSGLPGWRHRLAIAAYIHRFEWLIDALERDEFLLRSDYPLRLGIEGALSPTGLLRSSRLIFGSRRLRGLRPVSRQDVGS